MEEEEDLLDSLLAAATEHAEGLKEDIQNINNSSDPTKLVCPSNKFKEGGNILKETDIFQFASNLKGSSQSLKPKSIIHSGETDSSDDEGNRNYEDQKYNECGRDIKRLLNSKESSNSISSVTYGVSKKRVSSWKGNRSVAHHNSTVNSGNVNKSNLITKCRKDEQNFQDVLLDPIFCMRIINPKISSSMLIEKMQGRLAVRFSDLAKQIFAGNLKDKDWVISGVIVNKSPPKTSQKGSQYSVWTLSDLKGDIKTVALFMFSSAHKELGKTVVGTVVGVLNPSIMEKRDGSKDEAALSVDTAQKVMIFGQSKDFGICKSVKKNGDKCTAIVNLSNCEFCIYHIKQEYQKCSKRSELQANFAGKGLVNLRNKVLGKNEVFYAGKSYMAIPAKKSKKLEARDSSILQNLNGINGKSNNILKAKSTIKKAKKGSARHLDVSPAQRAKDLELLQKLGGISSLESKSNFSGLRSGEISLEDSKTIALSVISKLKAKKENSESKLTNKISQYDLKGDLFVNIDNKSTFSGKASETIGLESALSAISKLKAKKKTVQAASQCKENDEGKSLLLTLDEFQDELSCDELNYSDHEDNAILSAANSMSTGENKEVKTSICSNLNMFLENEAVHTSETGEFLKTFENSVEKIVDKETKFELGTIKGNEDIVVSTEHSLVAIGDEEVRTQASFKCNNSQDKVIHKAIKGNKTPKSSSKSNSNNYSNSLEKINYNRVENKTNSNRKMLFDSPKSQCNVKNSFSPRISHQLEENNDYKQIEAKDRFIVSPNSLFGSESRETNVDSSNIRNLSPKMSQFNMNSQRGNSESKVLKTRLVEVKRPDLNSNLNCALKNNLDKPSVLDKMTMGVPMLSGFGKSDLIDLSKPITSRHVDRAKSNALKYIQRNGPLKKVDPNSTKRSVTKKRNSDNLLKAGNVDSIQVNQETAAKKSKLQESEFISDRFKKMMAMTSRHADLLEQKDNEEKEKYFNKLEVKEKMEEKMSNTHKMKCKAVKCLKCKYTSFSASDLCKSENHPLKVFDAMKRFYKCSNCQNRTVTLELVPTRPCNNCGSSKWEKTGMMKEKIALVQHSLSIRGGEQQFVNSVIADANLDLLVPDD